MRPPCPPPRACVYLCIPQVSTSTYTTHTGEHRVFITVCCLFQLWAVLVFKAIN